jgi:CARDB
MRRRLLLGSAILAAGSLVPTTLALGSDQHATVKEFVCHPALKPGRRVVGVTAVMRPIPGTFSLSMRWQLLGTKAGHVTQVRGGDLGKWISPHPTTLGEQPGDVWVLKHAVTGLPVGSTYRFRVSFRWIGAGGGQIASSTHTSAGCWQPDMRPDLAVQSISVNPVPGDSSHNQYVVWIANKGSTSAGSFDVAFTPGGSAGVRQTATFPQLGAHQAVSETFTGPACMSGTAPTVTVDPDYASLDVSRANNSMTATCPGP